MTDREKLVALMDAAREYADFECDKRDGCSCCPNDSRNEFCLTPYMVDHLLANGVVVREFKVVEIDQFKEWIPVTERLPELHTKVLCCGVKGGRFIAELSEWGNGILYWTKRDGKGCPTVTHWMPLPEPPMRKGENG